jgi:RNA polymerase sigma-70 factor (ECF subfamily)
MAQQKTTTGNGLRQILHSRGRPEGSVAGAAASPGDELDERIPAIARGDRAAFVEIFHAVAPKVKSYLIADGLSGETAEAVTLDVMVAIWRNAPRYDPASAGGWSWIFGIVRDHGALG